MLLHDEDGLDERSGAVREAFPERLHDTAYAAAFEVAAVDLEMRMEEVRILQLLRASSISTRDGRAIERGRKARHRR